LLARLIKTKSLDSILRESEEHHLKRALGATDLIALGIGAIIGAGIFATVGTAAAGGAHHLGAGPALVISFVLTAIACAFSALCYAEFASLIPIAGSAYTYAYATLGELVAWIIGWDLILEYAVGNVAVAIGWSEYFASLLNGFGIHLSPWLLTSYWAAQPSVIQTAPCLLGIPIIFNLPAVLIVAFITWILVLGIKESCTFNAWIVMIKILILLFVIAVGFFYIRPENWSPFAPNGWKGIQTGAAIIFFAYIGFDAVSTAAEETKNPEKNLPIGMLGSLVICTVIYIAVTLVVTGMVPSSKLGVADPLAQAFSVLNLNWATGIISLGAVIAMTAVLLVFQLGQPRIFFSMSRDGLLPRFFERVHPKYRTPHVTTIMTGILVAFFAAFTKIDVVVELCNIGTLFAFVLVCGGIIVLRFTDRERHRPFRCPGIYEIKTGRFRLLLPVVPILGILSCLYLMLGLPLVTWIRFIIWLAVGLIFYFSYGYWKSRIGREAA
jgi:APA family basic amino acid/polyamine antiporter